MSFWDEFTELTPQQDQSPKTNLLNQPKPERNYLSDYPGIYTNDKGKFLVYATRLGKKHYVGSFPTLELAVSNQHQFILTGEKNLKRKRRTFSEQNQELRNLIENQDE